MSSCYSGFDDRSFEFDDSSFDSGYEKSFETDCNATPRKLYFEGAMDFYTTPETPSSSGCLGLGGLEQPPFTSLLDNSSNQSCRSARTLVEHVISKATATDAQLDFAPKLGLQTSTPTKKPPSEDQLTEPKPKRKYAVGKNRVTRSRSPSQVTRIKKHRRMKANDRERNRMHTLNDALERLRVTLPSLPEETKLTKIEILRFAHNYIFALEQVLESGGTINLDLEKLQNFTLSGERITKELFDALFVNPQPYPVVGMGLGMGYGMAARVPYAHSHASPTHQYAQAPHGHQALAACNNYEFYGSARHPYSISAPQRLSIDDPTSSPHFSIEKYELFKHTFEAAANTKSYGAHYPPLDAGYTQLAADAHCYMPHGAGAAESQPPRRPVETQLPRSTASPAASRAAMQLHHNSSFYSQTPPWKDYNEQIVNSNNDFAQFSVV